METDSKMKRKNVIGCEKQSLKTRDLNDAVNIKTERELANKLLYYMLTTKPFSENPATRRNKRPTLSTMLTLYLNTKFQRSHIPQQLSGYQLVKQLQNQGKISYEPY